MNGAELPCGSRIYVEPADADYKNNSKKSNEVTTASNAGMVGVASDIGYLPSAASTKASGEEEVTMTNDGTTKDARKKEEKAKNEEVGGEEAADDLDDFFSSLT